MTSTIKITADIITAARVAFGINEKYGVKNVKAKITIIPVYGHIINNILLLYLLLSILIYIGIITSIDSS